jgi:Ca2+-binding RTX toxin-like protein
MRPHRVRKWAFVPNQLVRPRVVPAVKKLTPVLSALALAAALVATDVSAARAEGVTCQGRPATIVGPTEGQITTGTEGDDVIVAPMYGNSAVWALGGDDTVCLVDAPSTVSRDPMVSVRAGAGDDSVVNETTTAIGWFSVELGVGADSYVGNEFGENVAASMSDDAVAPDTEVDAISTGGGSDFVRSGTPLPGWANHDVISTGSGSDGVVYAGLAGGSIDNGDGADSLFINGSWTGELGIDNTIRRASLGGGTVSWTNVDGFGARVAPGSSLSFAGSDADEHLNVSGTVLDLAAPATISMGGGDDGLRLENYLPTSVDTGAGDDTFSYLACRAARIEIDHAAHCTTATDQQVQTSLAGIESLFASSTETLDVVGTTGSDRLDLSAGQHVRVSGARGDDSIRAGARTVLINGGRGRDLLNGAARGDGLTIYGGRGADVLRGSRGRDRLFGGKGTDTANGRQNVDRCVAETRVNCERR